jgi:hypothetical protein
MARRRLRFCKPWLISSITAIDDAPVHRQTSGGDEMQDLPWFSERFRHGPIGGTPRTLLNELSKTA